MPTTSGGRARSHTSRVARSDGHHHHLVDEETGAVEPFEDPALEQAIEDAALRAGIELTGHEILLRGRRRPTGSA